MAQCERTPCTHANLTPTRARTRAPAPGRTHARTHARTRAHAHARISHAQAQACCCVHLGTYLEHGSWPVVEEPVIVVRELELPQLHTERAQRHRAEEAQ